VTAVPGSAKLASSRSEEQLGFGGSRAHFQTSPSLLKVEHLRQGPLWIAEILERQRHAAASRGEKDLNLRTVSPRAAN